MSELVIRYDERFYNATKDLSGKDFGSILKIHGLPFAYAIFSLYNKIKSIDELKINHFPILINDSNAFLSWRKYSNQWVSLIDECYVAVGMDDVEKLLRIFDKKFLSLL